MKDLILESKGIKTDQYFIPPFELREGELVIIYLFGGAHFDQIKEQLTAIFTGNIYDENVKIIKPLTFVPPFRESRFRSIFCPITVNGYLKRNANLSSSVLQKLFKIDAYNKTENVKNLSISQQKRLSLCAVFSKTINIVFDMRGEGAMQFRETYDFVQDEISNDGAAILIDWTDDLRNEASKFIEIEWLVDYKEMLESLKI